MSVHLLKPSEIKSLLALVGKMNYTFKTFIGDGDFSKTLLLEHCDSQNQVVGKVVERYNLGEFQIWPRLRHENLNPLLDMMANDDGTTLFICPLVGKSLRDVIEDSGFGQHPKCFERKKSYARDVLIGLEYLHKNSVCLMNLTENSVLINSSYDKAIISDFSRAVNVSSSDQDLHFESEGINLPPEAIENDTVHPKPFDIWTCGFMFLQVFTKHVLPWCSLGSDLLDGLDIELLRRTNKSSILKNDAATDLKGFLKPFLCTDPHLRVTASEALSSWYLEDSNDRLDEPAREFWKAASMITPFNKNYGQSLGDGDSKSTLIDSELPQSSKLLDPLAPLDRKRSGEVSSPKPNPAVIKSSENGSMSNRKCMLREFKKDSSTGTSNFTVPSVDLSHSLWNNEVSSDVRDKMKDNLTRMIEKFKLMTFTTNRSSSSLIDNELAFITKGKNESVSTPQSRSSNSSFGLEKLFIHNETPLQHQSKNAFSSEPLKEQLSLPENKISADQFHKRSLKSSSCSSQPKPWPDITIEDGKKFSCPGANIPDDPFHKRSPESPKFSLQPEEILSVKITDAEKFSCPGNNFLSNQSPHKFVNSKLKTEKLPKIRIQGAFLHNKSEESNVPKVPLSASPAFDDFRITCRLRTGVNEATNENQSFLRRMNQQFPSEAFSQPSHSKWPTTAELKLKHSQKLLDKKKQHSRRKDRSKTLDKKRPVDPNPLPGMKPEVIKTPKPTGKKTAVKTVKPNVPAAKPAEKTVKPKAGRTKHEAKGVKHARPARSKTEEGFDVTAVPSDTIDVSLDTPLFTYGQPKVLLGQPTEETTKKKKKGFFHLPCKKSKSVKKPKAKSNFSWFLSGS